MKLLIVDDSEVVRGSIERAARALGVEQVLAAGDGESAVALFEAERPNMVTMDITMPRLDGIECVTRIASAAPGTPVLVVSALNSQETAMQALSRGASGFLTKPFTATEIEMALRDLIELAQSAAR